MIRPDSQSAVVTVASTATGTAPASTTCGRYLAKYGSRPSSPLVPSVAISPGRCLSSHDGPSVSTCLASRERSRSLIATAPRSAVASPAVHRDCPGDDDRQQRQQGAAQGDGRRGTGRRPGQSARQKLRLGQDQARHRETAQARCDQVAAGARRVSQQPSRDRANGRRSAAGRRTRRRSAAGRSRAR